MEIRGENINLNSFIIKCKKKSSIKLLIKMTNSKHVLTLITTVIIIIITSITNTVNSKLENCSQRIKWAYEILDFNDDGNLDNIERHAIFLVISDKLSIICNSKTNFRELSHLAIQVNNEQRIFT